MPLHPGALRYYQEVGLLGPDDNLEVALADDVRRAETAAYDPNGALKAKARTIAATAGPAPTAATPNNGGDEQTFVVYFGLGDKDVNGIGMQELAEVSAYADNLTAAEITISGHTDRSGDPVYNAYLAEVRAHAVIDVLRNRFGVKGHEIRLETHGADRPAVEGGDMYQPQNRRVEIEVRPIIDAGQPQQTVTPEGDDASPAWKKRAAI
jgi:outer membrane protein OmpA-like peptidoglycan-associated protein